MIEKSSKYVGLSALQAPLIKTGCVPIITEKTCLYTVCCLVHDEHSELSRGSTVLNQ